MSRLGVKCVLSSLCISGVRVLNVGLRVEEVARLIRVKEMSKFLECSSVV